MALLGGTALFLINHVIPKLPKSARVLGIARMFMTWNIDKITYHLSAKNIQFDPAVAERIRRQNSIYTSKDFLELLGFTDYQDIDMNPAQGCSIVHDLNTPLAAEYENQFDFVLENGTIEHVFDIKTAIGNIARAVRVDGIVCHISPMDAFNHGFYNFSINFFNDFYRVNGFDQREFYLTRSAIEWKRDQTVIIEPIAYTHEELYVNRAVYESSYNKLGIAFVGRKYRHITDVITPVQAAYDPELRVSSTLIQWDPRSP
jgi:SAM-dependent methyltransferase